MSRAARIRPRWWMWCSIVARFSAVIVIFTPTNLPTRCVLAFWLFDGAMLHAADQLDDEDEKIASRSGE